MKRLSTQKTIQKLFSLTPVHINYLEHFMEEKGMLSESDVMRQALAFFHDKTFPDYVYRETELGRQKRTAREEKERLENMTDEQFATEVLKAKVVDSKLDKKFAIVHTIANGILVFPLPGIKEFIARNKDIQERHLEILRDLPVEDRLTDNTKRSYQDDAKYQLIF